MHFPHLCLSWGCREHRDFEMIAVTEDGQIWLTEGIAPSFVLDEAFANMEQHVITGDQQ